MLNAECWMLNEGRRLGAGGGMVAIGDLGAFRCLLLAVSYQLSAIGYRLSVHGYQLSAVSFGGFGFRFFGAGGMLGGAAGAHRAPCRAGEGNGVRVPGNEFPGYPGAPCRANCTQDRCSRCGSDHSLHGLHSSVCLKRPSYCGGRRISSCPRRVFRHGLASLRPSRFNRPCFRGPVSHCLRGHIQPIRFPGSLFHWLRGQRPS